MQVVGTAAWWTLEGLKGRGWKNRETVLGKKGLCTCVLSISLLLLKMSQCLCLAWCICIHDPFSKGAPKSTKKWKCFEINCNWCYCLVGCLSYMLWCLKHRNLQSFRRRKKDFKIAHKTKQCDSWRVTTNVLLIKLNVSSCLALFLSKCTCID